MKARMTFLDVQTVKQIRHLLEEALKPLAQEFDLPFTLRNGAYRGRNCKFDIEVAVLDSDGKPVTEEVQRFECNPMLFGFEATDRGKQFMFQGQSFILSGFTPKNDNVRYSSLFCM